MQNNTMSMGELGENTGIIYQCKYTDGKMVNHMSGTPLKHYEILNMRLIGLVAVFRIKRKN